MASMYTHPYMAAHLSCPTGSSSFRWVLTSFVLPVHNQGASLATIQGHALWFNFLPATSSFFVLSLLIQTLRLQHLSADAYCNHYGCSLLLGYAAFTLGGLSFTFSVQLGGALKTGSYRDLFECDLEYPSCHRKYEAHLLRNL